MKLIVGLGNPGIIYSGTRHNIGFEVIKQLAKTEKIALKKEKNIKALLGKGKIGDGPVLFSLPLTFMNLSGEAVKSIINRYKIEIADLLVVCDDLDLEFGRIKICSGGSSAGHRGIKSMASSLEGTEFNRLRIGIGRPKEDLSTSDFVLSRFNRQEKKDILGIINKSVECCNAWVEEGIEKTMNNFNRKGVAL